MPSRPFIAWFKILSYNYFPNTNKFKILSDNHYP